MLGHSKLFFEGRRYDSATMSFLEVQVLLNFDRGKAFAKKRIK